MKDPIAPELLLGKKARYPSRYTPELLQAIPRDAQRRHIGANITPPPFFGYDLWNAYEISWLDTTGMPQNALGVFIIQAETTYLIESKSLKLYLNSFNQAVFKDITRIASLIEEDMQQVLQTQKGISCQLFALPQLEQIVAKKPPGFCLDLLSVDVKRYTVDPTFLAVQAEFEVAEQVYSDKFRSVCLVTGQPDWASIQIEYTGKKIEPEGLLRYLISYREHAEFHEQCIERIFMDLQRQCQPEKLLVEGRFTRRGGLDINPVRASFPVVNRKNDRGIRQ